MSRYRSSLIGERKKTKPKVKQERPGRPRKPTNMKSKARSVSLNPLSLKILHSLQEQGICATNSEAVNRALLAYAEEKMPETIPLLRGVRAN